MPGDKLRGGGVPDDDRLGVAVSAPVEAPPQATASPSDFYLERRDRFRAEAAVLATAAARLANLRLLAFFGALAVAAWAAWTGLAPLWAGVLVLLAVFGVLVVRYRRAERERRHVAGLADLAEEALWRLARDWERLPLRHERRADPLHPYAVDLDLFGRGSLLHLLEAVGTRLGDDTLADWLLGPADPARVRARHAAIADLAPRAAWRDELLWRGRATGRESPDPAPFLAWAEGSTFLSHRRALVWGARLSPPLFWVLLLAHGAGLTAWPFWLLPLLVNLLIGWRLVGPSVERLTQVRHVAGALGAYADALELLSETSFEAPLLRRITADLGVPSGPSPGQRAVAGQGAVGQGFAVTRQQPTTAARPAQQPGVATGTRCHPAPVEIRRLDRIVRFAQPSSSMIYPLIELTTLWNVHVLSALEGWQQRSGAHVRAWLVALGEAEALAALARLAHDHPAWAFADFDDAARRLDARALGHPLLRDDVRVSNDVALGPPGTFLLVTGSNMSGKSTLLRAIGVNVVLAQAGAPVCAAALSLPSLDLWTSMRVSDSLERGVSFFMAELQRLKQVVDAASHAEPRLVLYLLDEILQGTNTAERQIAARRIIRTLLRCPAIGAVSTHDLTLAASPELAEIAQSVHLTETIVDEADGAHMTFDYHLRPGIARSTNALRLLEMVGLPTE
ncbi:MAG: DNA mismatch repair protein MutS [Chloroflexi bacterium]|nr:DNA mismatch repair protein MutS [Chloroflexota bacterium]